MILDTLFESRAEAVNLGHPKDPALVELFGIGEDTTSGVDVTESTALTFSAVYGAVKAISETFAGLERGVHEIAENGDSELQADHLTTDLINATPNDNMTPVVFWETLEAYLLLWGNAFAEIERSRLGDPLALWPRHPQRVEIQRLPSGALAYRVHPPADSDGEVRTVQAADMLHVPCMGTGEVGVSVISYARESIGVGMGAERFGGAFFGNGAKVGGLLKLARPATRERKRQLAEDWKTEFGGAKNSSRLAVIDHDSDYTQIGIPPEDAQFLETRIFQVQEVCRWFRISPTKVMDFSHATFSNIEEINKQFASETILPWAIKWAQECRRKLLPEPERTNHVIKHDLSKLVEGDLDTLTQIFSRGRQWGWYSINDVRRKLGENTIGPDGDEYLTPQNMSPVGEEEEKPPEQPLPAAGNEESDDGEDEFRLNPSLSEGQLQILLAGGYIIPPIYEARRKQLAAALDDCGETAPTQAQAEAIRSEFQSLRNEMTNMRSMQQDMKQDFVAAIHNRYAWKERSELSRAVKKRNVMQHMDRYWTTLESKLRTELEVVTTVAAEEASRHVSESRQMLLAALECQRDELADNLDKLGNEWGKRYV